MIELIRDAATSSPASRSAGLAERIYAQLKQDIFDFRLLPGDRFTESEVAERMGASRTPVREALFRLQREGYVEVLYRNGWRTRPFDFQYFENLYDVRTILESAAVKALCELAAFEPISEPAPALAELQRTWLVGAAERLTDAATLAALDERFHETLVAATGNGEMARIHRDLSEKIRIIRRLDFTQVTRVEATYEEHASVLKAIIERRSDHAQLLLKAHIDESRSEVRKITLHMLYRARQEATSFSESVESRRSGEAWDPEAL